MKKYIRFEWGEYYPDGGMHDLSGSFDNLEEAITALYKPRGDHYGEPNIQIVDRDTWKIVWASGFGIPECDF